MGRAAAGQLLEAMDKLQSQSAFVRLLRRPGSGREQRMLVRIEDGGGTLSVGL